MIVEVNDGGKKLSKHPKEVRDCSVRAVAIAFDLEYDKAHKALKKLGRKDKSGFNPYPLYKSGKYARKKVERLAIRKMSVKTFIEWHTTPDGTYLVRIRGHIFTIKNRVVHDSWGFSDGCIVLTAYKVGK